jgi:hypothetical protein
MGVAKRGEVGLRGDGCGYDRLGEAKRVWV